ncbi:hypothetical protein SAMN03159341_11613 [Paenibacillus sp. 1_12]|uniref:hypothetical protein n=1 Tax=Paenibacillus sp. 1_12 TaxID=1566278 RepID=UPI0008EBA989|nr:hypothetical protein [Paenibacillus sp. 1_12]SFM08504.1 hypothetical protein SAMN03159341_11613 [Paenibacillus sp. 1_12]
MIGSLVVVALAIVIGVIKVPSLLKKGWYKEAIVNVSLLVAGAAICILPMLLISLSDPLIYLKVIYKPVSDWFFNTFTAK